MVRCLKTILTSIVVACAGTCVPALASAYKIDCSQCTGQESKYYVANKLKSENTSQAFHRLSHCFDDISASQFSSILVTTGEIRNVFEATGKIFGFDDFYANKDWLGQEEKYLHQAVSSGYWKGMWPFGATDCETHARNLKAYLDGLFKKQGVGGDFAVEVVNSYPNVKATDAAANPLPGSNHYIVRIVSLRTGRSYLGDVYTGVSFSREEDSSRIIFNDYEACFFDQVTLKRYGKKMSDGSWQAIAASFTPILRTKLAQEAKSAAGQCLQGVPQASIGD